MKSVAPASIDAATEQRVAEFLGRYTPEIAAQLSDGRRRLKAVFPRGFELVFDNYNALVFGFSPVEKASQSFISLAGYPKWVTLFFLHGAALQDPRGLLQGTGKQVRSIRLAAAGAIDSAEVQALIAQAMQPHLQALLDAPPLSTRVMMALAKQRPRRPATAAANPQARA